MEDKAILATSLKIRAAWRKIAMKLRKLRSKVAHSSEIKLIEAKIAEMRAEHDKLRNEAYLLIVKINRLEKKRYRRIDSILAESVEFNTLCEQRDELRRRSTAIINAVNITVKDSYLEY